MRTLLTGGAGFIGSNLVDSLVEHGARVVVLDDLSTGRRSNLASALEAGVDLVDGDVRDVAAVRSAFSLAEPEVVFHLAAQIDVRRSIADPRFDLDVNVGGTIRILDAAREAGVGRFVFASTGGAIYGEGDGRELPLDETAEAAPGAPYGQSKLAAEGYVGLNSRLYGLSVVSLRLANVYGPRQDPLGEAGVAAIFSGELLDGRTPTVFGDGLQTRDYVYVGDVVEAFRLAADADAGGVFNIGTGTETTVYEVGRAVAAASGREFEPEYAPARLGEVRRIAIDPSRAAGELGWKPRTALADGLGRTVDWARATAAARGADG